MSLAEPRARTARASTSRREELGMKRDPLNRVLGVVSQGPKTGADGYMPSA